MEQTITVTANEQDLVFNVTTTAYNRYLDEGPNQRITPTAQALNFLNRTVTPESKAKLTEILQLPSAGLQIADLVATEFTPELEISIKK